MLGGCGTRAGSPDTSRGSYKVGNPYTIAGRTYYPAENWSYAETGQASWYGPGFHGNSTANGEPYNQNLPSAAHRTLPMPSIVRVTNLDNGRVAVVRINDRGPFARERIIDLSKAAAEQLDMTRAGTAAVRVELMERESRVVKDVAMGGGSAAEQLAAIQRPSSQPAPVMVAAAPPPPPPAPVAEVPPPPPPSSPAAFVQASAPPAVAPAVVPAVATVPPAGGYFVQAGAFASLDNAERLRTTLARFGDTSIGQTVSTGGVTVYRVRIGPYASPDEAYNVQGSLQRAGHSDCRVVSE
ncbi:septal ring lytic transglycosylase RlpA family protein [Vineibacter terrae]|uniref:septal ring lytic transglycosylase RlpA family protein n=1 Tax=Vineibacter terrae TaxID=2586908 RepID=UPI001E52E1F9|nr:septal ring lytic transglycosylase RlpA family protein [Vineibacter terrae]